MGHKTRDLTGIEVRRRKKGDAFRGYAADPTRPGRKINGPWGTYEEAAEWRRKVLTIKLEAKRRKQQQRTDETLARVQSALLGRETAP